MLTFTTPNLRDQNSLLVTPLTDNTTPGIRSTVGILTLPLRPWVMLAYSVAHQTLGRGVPGLIPILGVICCGLEQVAFPQLNVYSVYMFLNSRNESCTELMLVVKILSDFK